MDIQKLSNNNFSADDMLKYEFISITINQRLVDNIQLIFGNSYEVFFLNDKKTPRYIQYGGYDITCIDNHDHDKKGCWNYSSPSTGGYYYTKPDPENGVDIISLYAHFQGFTLKLAMEKLAQLLSIKITSGSRFLLSGTSNKEYTEELAIPSFPNANHLPAHPVLEFFGIVNSV